MVKTRMGEVIDCGPGRPKIRLRRPHMNGMCNFTPCGKAAIYAVDFLNAEGEPDGGPFPLVCEAHADPAGWEWPDDPPYIPLKDQEEALHADEPEGVTPSQMEG